MKGSVSHSGVLPYRLGADGMELLIITTLQRRRWTIPRGHLHKKRTPSETARLEAFEEAGLVGELHDAPVGVFCDWRGQTTDRVLLYPLRVVGQASEWPEKQRRQRQWIRARAAERFVSEELWALIRRFNRAIGFGELEYLG